MKKIYLILVGICFFSASFAQTSKEIYSKYGDVIIKQMSTAPFPHIKRANGHTYNKEVFPKDKHYIDSSVLIFIPKGYRKSEKVDFIVHFHGWRNNIDSVLSQFSMIEQFIESRKNAILIIPEGPKNAPDSFGGKFEDEDGFKKFMNEVMGELKKLNKNIGKEIGNIILSGHSGGYHVMSFIVMRGGMNQNIKELYLFDALYGQTEKFVYWLDHFQGKIINIYTEDGGTKNESESLMDDLRGWGKKFISKTDEECSENELQKNKLIFLYTKLGHNEVLSKNGNLTKYLKASIFKNIK